MAKEYTEQDLEREMEELKQQDSTANAAEQSQSEGGPALVMPNGPRRRPPPRRKDANNNLSTFPDASAENK